MISHRTYTRDTVRPTTERKFREAYANVLQAVEGTGSRQPLEYIRDEFKSARSAYVALVRNSGPEGMDEYSFLGTSRENLSQTLCILSHEIKKKQDKQRKAKK